MSTDNIKPKVYIGKVIQNAVVFNVQNWQGQPMNSDHLLHNVARLFTLLEERKIDYLLVGGIALLQYVEGRNTEDIDLIMALASLKKLPEIKITGRDNNFARGRFDELQIDILLTRNRLFEKVRQGYATRQHFVERDIPCATVEGLLLLKLYALPSLYRQGNFARVGLYENDIATLMFSYRPNLEPLFSELAQHLSETDLTAIQQIVTEIEQRLDRFNTGFAE
ncbi:MAG: hypothetical protein KDI02_00350 [Anaerolineae bacterium]|nr:hypothetical protein [Anaerolineae bacterium]MCB0222115.1 hypothetical protein [Anaerolineae bacterium]